MDPPVNSMHRWLWYASKTADSVTLDASAYGSTSLNGNLIPFPDWACKSPNGGVHVNSKRLRIDADISEKPNANEDYSWTRIYCVTLISNTWLNEIHDTIDKSKIGIGAVRMAGRPLPGWSTLHEVDPPSLLSTEGHLTTCPLCGKALSILHGREYFSDPTVIGRPFIVNTSGLFVREDIAVSRSLPTPRGTYEPQVVEFET